MLFDTQSFTAPLGLKHTIIQTDAQHTAPTHHQLLGHVNMEERRITCIVLLEVTQVADDSDPDEHGAQAQEDAAHVIASEHLGGGARASGNCLCQSVMDPDAIFRKE